MGRIILLVIFVLGLSACSDIRLAALPEEKVNVQSVGAFCTTLPESVKSYVKVMFVMDKSGSNTTTDPGATKRAGGVESFYNARKTDTSYQWGMIGFRDSPTEAYIGDAELPIYTQDDSLVQGAIQRLREGDGGGTPYGAAIALTQTAIEHDLELHPDEDNFYMVFFVSDGVPTDVTGEDTLRARVRDLIDVAPGRIVLSTAYYDAGSPNGTAIDRLRAMAEEGNGKFTNFQNSNDFDFDDLIVPPPGREPWQIKNFIVWNHSASICIDGGVDTDSDGDGLCDKDERDPRWARLGLNPAKRFSRSGGYGDYFVWRSEIIDGRPLKSCTDRTDEDWDGLTVCEEAYIENATPSNANPDVVPMKNGDIKNPDTDLDGYPDMLEIFSFRDKSSAMNARDVLESQDGESENAGVQIKQHRDPTRNDPGEKKYDTRLRVTGFIPETGQTCYEFRQTYLPLYPTLAVSADGNYPHMVHKAGENLVGVYYIQVKQREPNGFGIYFYNFQKLKAEDQVISDTLGYNAGLQIKDGIFRSYVVPKR